MLPVLLDLTVIKIYTFGVFLLFAFFWGSYFLWKNISLTSYKEEDIFDGLFIAFRRRDVYGRLFYVLSSILIKFGFEYPKIYFN
jgi:prolipoprotein diacylglyceryltransferase